MHIFKKRSNKEKIDSSKENLSFQALLIRVIKFKTPKNPVHESGRDFYLLLLTSSLLLQIMLCIDFPITFMLQYIWKILIT